MIYALLFSVHIFLFHSILSSATPFCWYCICLFILSYSHLPHILFGLFGLWFLEKKIATCMFCHLLTWYFYPSYFGVLHHVGVVILLDHLLERSKPFCTYRDDIQKDTPVYIQLPQLFSKEATLILSDIDTRQFSVYFHLGQVHHVSASGLTFRHRFRVPAMIPMDPWTKVLVRGLALVVKTNTFPKPVAYLFCRQKRYIVHIV